MIRHRVFEYRQRARDLFRRRQLRGGQRILQLSPARQRIECRALQRGLRQQARLQRGAQRPILRLLLRRHRRDGLPGAIEIGDLVRPQLRFVAQLLRAVETGLRLLRRPFLLRQRLQPLLQQPRDPPVELAHRRQQPLQHRLRLHPLRGQRTGIGEFALQDEVDRRRFIAGQCSGLRQRRLFALGLQVGLQFGLQRRGRS